MTQLHVWFMTSAWITLSFEGQQILGVQNHKDQQENFEVLILPHLFGQPLVGPSKPERTELGFIAAVTLPHRGPIVQGCLVDWEA